MTVSLQVSEFTSVEYLWPKERLTDHSPDTRGLNTYYGVWDNTPDTHGVLYYGTCVFEAGTRNIQETWIGSSNIADITELALNKWQVRSSSPEEVPSFCANEQSLAVLLPLRDRQSATTLASGSRLLGGLSSILEQSLPR